MSEGASIWPAVTAPGPVARSVMRLGPSACMRSGQLLDVQHDVDDVLAHALERGELVHDAVDLHGGHRRALQGGEQHAAQAVAERHAEAALERLGHERALRLGVGAGLDLRLLGTDKLVPVSFDHGWVSLGTQDRRPRTRSGAGELGT